MTRRELEQSVPEADSWQLLFEEFKPYLKGEQIKRVLEIGQRMVKIGGVCY